MQRLCVYCGSSTGTSNRYAAVAANLGEHLVQNKIGLVYGGASKGIMGVIADTVLLGGGDVVGVIPQALVDREVAHPNLSKLHIVQSMHERKTLMADLADAFVALPGGYGTLEEIIEVLTWGQLKFHTKPCALLNAGGYFDHLLAFLDHAVAEGFIRPEHREMLLVANSAEDLTRKIASYIAPHADKLPAASR